jgi:hypothetical protein
VFLGRVSKANSGYRGLRGLMIGTLVTSLFSAQGLILGLKLTNQITWGWLMVFSPTLLSVFGLGLFALLVIMGLMGGK